jgi:hypothetical protein
MRVCSQQPDTPRGKAGGSETAGEQSKQKEGLDAGVETPQIDGDGEENAMDSEGDANNEGARTGKKAAANKHKREYRYSPQKKAASDAAQEAQEGARAGEVAASEDQLTHEVQKGGLDAITPGKGGEESEAASAANSSSEGNHEAQSEQTDAGAAEAGVHVQGEETDTDGEGDDEPRADDKVETLRDMEQEEEEEEEDDNVQVRVDCPLACLMWA